MIHKLYNSALTLAVPFVAGYLSLHPRHRSLLRRFAPTMPSSLEGRRPIWVHACSLGEVNTAIPLLDALRESYPHTPVVLTVSTRSGMDRAHTLPPEYHPTWFPFDHPASVRRFLRLLQPRLLILIETELWPNVLQECHRSAIPVALVNGRISKKYFRRYKLQRPLLAPLLAQIRVAAMQSKTDADRIQALGIVPDRTLMSGNLKFDGASELPPLAERTAWRNELGLPENAPVVTFGSTRPGDEALAAECIQSMRGKHPHVRWIVAPRHNKRLQEALKPFSDTDIVLRSEMTSDHPAPGSLENQDAPIVILDTQGELLRCYAVSCVAIIGGSFFPGVEGHNPIEPAALGVATLFGPFMGNFRVAAESLLQADGAVQVDSSALCDTLDAFLSDETRRTRIGENGRRAVMENQGALAITMGTLAPLL
jgi:3-deoxy-D-manno-octulosonic-acid transferase